MSLGEIQSRSVTDMPGGWPLIVHVNGAVPPLNAAIARSHGHPRVQSSEKFE
jgi:hypothetical protein